MLTLPPLEDRLLTCDEQAAVLDRTNEILQLTYRGADLGNFEDPLEEAVYILLSRQTREAGYQRAHRELRRRWPSWRSLMHAPAEDILDAIRPAGFGVQRAAQVQGLLCTVAAECKRRRIRKLSLDWLRELPDDEAERYLVSLPGIGQKSARCIMHYSLNRKALAVDTHVRRILDRLGLVPDLGEKVKHARYEAIVPAGIRQQLHVNLIHHGRAVCKTSRPRCGECPLVSFCHAGRAAQRAAADRPVAVELFAGGGGLGAGFASAGYFVAVAIERDRHAAQTYRVNHPGTVVIEADATTISADELVRLAPACAAPTAVIAGPPCQGYSAAGKRKTDDGRNQLFVAVVKLAREMDARFVAIENVPGMRKVAGQSYVDSVIDTLEEAGYAAQDYLLRACDFGVPQLRHRLIFLAQRVADGSAPDSPEPTHCAGSLCQACCASKHGLACNRPATPTVLETLRDLPLLAAGEEAEYRVRGPGVIPLINGSTMAHSERVIAKIHKFKAGEGPISYRRLHRDVARTIVAGHRALPVHPTLDRTISVREAARIQGFDDRHVFAGPRYEQPLQVANAVPPALACAVAVSLLRAAAAGGDRARPA